MTTRRAFIAAGAATLPFGLPEILCAQTSSQRPLLFNVADFGAAADGKTKATVALQRALDACFAVGGGTVYVGPGVYSTAPIYLKSNTTLYLEAGARIIGSTALEDFTVEPSRVSGESARAAFDPARPRFSVFGSLLPKTSPD